VRQDARIPNRRLHGLLFKLPAMITCSQFEDFILAYLEDDLPRRQKLMFEVHLRICAECRAYLAAYRTAMDLTKAQTNIDLNEVPEDLVTTILASLKADK